MLWEWGELQIPARVDILFAAAKSMREGQENPCPIKLGECREAVNII